MSVTKTTLTTAGKVSIFGWLENLSVWKSLPYPVKGALLRGLKAGLSVVVAALLTAATAGTLFPATWGPMVLAMLVMVLQAADKYIREWNVDEDAKQENGDIPTSDNIPGDIPEGEDAVNQPPVNTDATVAVPPPLPEPEEIELDDSHDPVDPTDLPDNT